MRYASAALGSVVGVALVPSTRSFLVLLAPLWILAAGAEWLRSSRPPPARTTSTAPPLRALSAAAGGCVGALLGSTAAEAVLGSGGTSSPLRLVAAAATWGCAVAAGMGSGLSGVPSLTVFAGTASLVTAAGVGANAALPQLGGLVVLVPVAMLLCGAAAGLTGQVGSTPAARSEALGSMVVAALGAAVAILITGTAAAFGAQAAPAWMSAMTVAALFASVLAAAAYAVR